MNTTQTTSTKLSTYMTKSEMQETVIWAFQSHVKALLAGKSEAAASYLATAEEAARQVRLMGLAA